MHLKAETLDDLLRSVLSELVASTDWVRASRGQFTELFGPVLHLTNPRARLSRSETRGKVFSALGEWLWYLSGQNDYAFIDYYLQGGYEKDTRDRITVPGGYGERLANHHGQNQLQNVIGLLKERRSSRRAVIQLFDAADLARDFSTPCTCTLQFLVRNERLDALVNMRSNDAYRGLPHDVFAFTMLQELIARSVGVEVGEYKHCVGNLHLYDNDHENARAFLGESWQATMPMPPMPAEEPWPALAQLQQAERDLREGRDFSLAGSALAPYWQDLVRLLQAYRAAQDKNVNRLRSIRQELSSATYRVFVDSRIDKLQGAGR